MRKFTFYALPVLMLPFMVAGFLAEPFIAAFNSGRGSMDDLLDDFARRGEGDE